MGVEKADADMVEGILKNDDFVGGPITIRRRLDGAVRIEFGSEIIVVSPVNAVAIAEALLKEAGAQMRVVRAG